MSLRDHMAKLTAGLGEDDNESAPAKPRRSGSIPATASLMHFSEGAHELVEENKALKLAHGMARMIALDLIDDSPHHIGELDSERVAAIEENVKHNPQTNPVVLRPKEDGRFELLAGRHRVQAFRNLGRSEIEATLKKVTDDEALRIVVYDNHVAPNLSDYQKYLGFERIREVRGLTINQLAEESGTSRAALLKIMQFANLPREAQDVIASHHKAFGSNLFAALAPLVEGHSDRIVEAVQLVAEGKLNQGAAAGWVTKPPSRDHSPAPVSFPVMHGKHRFAEIRVKRAGRLEIDFARPEDAAALMKKLQEFLQQVAKAK